MSHLVTKRFLVCFTCALIALTAGCEATATRGSDPTAQRLSELKARSDTGAMSKDEYERQRAEIKDEELRGMKPPTDEAIRGILHPRY